MPAVPTGSDDSSPTARRDGAEFPTAETVRDPRSSPVLVEVGELLAIRTDERYDLREVLGKGGMGEVWLAADRQIGRDVAIKVARAGIDGDGLARFIREARIQGQLDHPAVVPVHDLGIRDGATYFTMKRVRGETLATLCGLLATGDVEVRRRATPRRLLTAFVSACHAVELAHARGILHRDLKPANIMLGDHGEVYVLDWGLAKIAGVSDGAPSTAPSLPPGLDGALTEAGQYLGTPGYMAPEQARGEPLDERADVYALGATLYQVLTGALPYGDRDADATLAALRAGPPPPITSREPRVPDDLAAIVGKAMARAPADRYPTGRELAEDLHRYQTGRLVAAHRYRATTRAWRWLRRHRAWLAVAAAVAATAGAVVLGLRGQPARRDPCADVATVVAGTWNADARAAGARAFAATGVPYATAAWGRAAAALDAHAQRIAAMRVEACRATHDGGQPAAVLDLRLRCLDQRLDELAGVVGLFAHADASVVAREEAIRGALSGVADCADRELLAEQARRPADPARRARIEGLLVEGRRFEQLLAAGQAEAHPWQALMLTMRALSSGEPQLGARLLTRLSSMSDDAAVQEQILWTAAGLAERAHDDRLRGSVLNKLIGVAVDRRGDYPRALQLIDQALALADRTGDVLQASELYIYRSHAAQDLGHIATAIDYAERAVTLAGAAGADPDHARFNLAGAYFAAGRAADADRILGEVVASLRRQYGSDVHPDVGRALSNQADARYVTGDVAGAIALLREARASFAHTQPDDSRDVLHLRRNLAVMQEAIDPAAAQRELEAIRPDIERVFGVDSEQAIVLFDNLGTFAEHRGDAAGALGYYREGLARASHHGDTRQVAELRMSTGSVLTQLGRPREAIPELEAALAFYQARPGSSPTDVAWARAELGRCRVDTGDPRRAVDDLEGALAVYDTAPGEELSRGLYRTALAQAYWALGDRARARTVAAEARRWFVAIGADGADGLAELDGWERTRR